MNEFFELLHGGHSAVGIFVIDVIMFFALAMVLRALVFLAKYKISELVEYTRRGGSVPRYLDDNSSPIQSRKGPVSTTRPVQNTKPNKRVQ